jgi:major type 1 subunit fimbrin (pilin)
MRKSFLISSIICTSILLSPLARAADGTITFSGNVIAQTCTINGSTKDLAVTLPIVSASSLATAGATAGATPFSIALTGCTQGTKSVHAYFEPGSKIDTSTGDLILDAGGATQVEIQLLNSDQSVIKLGQADASQNWKPLAVSSSGAATLPFYAQYYATGAATAGPANTSVMYTLVYQ